jgi:hypothetical protein
MAFDTGVFEIITALYRGAADHILTPIGYHADSAFASRFFSLTAGCFLPS